MNVCKASGYVLMSKDKADGHHDIIAILDDAANALAISEIVDAAETPASGVLVTITGGSVTKSDAAVGTTDFKAPKMSITGPY